MKLMKFAYGALGLLMLVWIACVEIFSVARCRNYAKKPFVCPCCGETFHAKWYQLFGGRETTLVMRETAKLKCPHCGETDLCRWMSEAAE